MGTDAKESEAYDAFRRAPFPAGERMIAKTPHAAFNYAITCLKGPFPLGEPAIAVNSYLSIRYAIDVLHGPFPAGERVISRTFESSWWYVASVLGLVPPQESRPRDEIRCPAWIRATVAAWAKTRASRLGARIVLLNL